MRIKQLVVIVAILTFCMASQAAVNDYSLWLRAQPQAIVADSLSSTTITAEVRDESGHPVADDTLVTFTTSLGIIETNVRTVAGVARARLRSDTTVGTALVSAVAANGRAVAQLRVDFLAPGTEMFDESFISVSSDKHLGYDVGKQIVDSAGGVKIYNRGLDIQAEEAQIDVRKNILRARARMGGDNIIISRDDKKVEASALYYDLTSMKGVLITPAEDGAKRMLFRGRDFLVQPDEEPDEKLTFDFEAIAEANVFIRAKSILIHPGEEVKIKHANLYMEGDKVLSIPLHVVPLKGTATGANQMITYGSDGVRVDLPIYYSLTPNGTGSFRIKHSEPTGWGYYSGRPGWQVDMQQDYNIGSSSEGAITLDQLATSDWGLRWNHRQQLNADSQVFTYLDFPSHENIYGNMDYSRSMGDYTFSLNFIGNKRRNYDGTYSSRAYLQSRPKPLISNAVTYAFSTRASYQNSVSNNGSRTGTGLGMQFYGKPLQFGPNSNLNTSLTVARDWGGSSPGTSLYANAGYYRGLGDIGSLGLNYTYSWANAARGYNDQRISADLSLRPSLKWDTHLTTIYGLNDRSISAFADFGYTFMRSWRLQLLGTYQKSPLFDYTDAEVALAKAIGRQEGRLIWSQSQKRLRVEFSALSF
ncbi:MAG: invasin domain 3-containing protein [Armatimonadota bacterium]|nr:hypothetical protein [bacterium]